MKKFNFLLFFLAFSLLNPLNAVFFVYEFNTEYSGGSDPVGPKPWITATFTQVDSAKVQLELSNVNLTGNEFIGSWYFNFNDSLDVNSLNFNRIGGTASADPSISTGLDSFNGVGGGGRYDIEFDFPQPKNSRFGVGDNIIYEITGINPLNIDMFNFKSSPQGGNGTWYSAAHVQGIGDNADGSGWVGANVIVPEPSTYLMLSSLLGLSLLLISRSKKRTGSLGKKN